MRLVHAGGRPFSFGAAAARAALFSAVSMVLNRGPEGSLPLGGLRASDLVTLVTSHKSLPQLAHS
jgi:hypothetical protein